MKRAIVLGGVLAALVVASPAAAQATFGLDAGLFSSYVWRGITYTNKPVLQPDAYVTIPLGKASVTAGGWANIDIGKYDDPNNDLSESGGASAFNVAEFDWWGEIGIPAGPATITAGVTGYIFPNDVGFTKDFNTIEVYGKVGLSGPLSPKVSAYYDVDKVKGLYVEGSVTHALPLGPKSLNLGALVGWTGGQEAKTGELNNFANSGLTHVDLSASIGLSAGPLSITPSVHGVFGLDDFAAFTKPSNFGQSDTKFKIWGGVMISWSHTGGSAEEE